MTTRKGTKGFLFGAIAGGVIGSVTALLLAPKAGKELRRDIAEQAQKMGDSTAKAAERVTETTGRIAKEIGNGAVDIVERTKYAASQAVTGFKSLGQEIQEEELAAVSGFSDHGEDIHSDNLQETIEDESETDLKEI